MWHVLRISYSQEEKALAILSENGIETYFPTRRVAKRVKGKLHFKTRPLIPNIIFANSTRDALDPIARNNLSNTIIHYYYDHTQKNEFGRDIPLVVPQNQMDNFIMLSSIDNPHIKVASPTANVSLGDYVEITEGEFKGIRGYVTRFASEQRVAIVLQGLCIVGTAYIPSAFMKRITPNPSLGACDALLAKNP